MSLVTQVQGHLNCPYLLLLYCGLLKFMTVWLRGEGVWLGGSRPPARLTPARHRTGEGES